MIRSTLFRSLAHSLCAILCRSLGFTVRIIPTKTNPTARATIKTLMGSTLMFQYAYSFSHICHV